jgi:hypothetical protein
VASLVYHVHVIAFRARNVFSTGFKEVQQLVEEMAT